MSGRIAKWIAAIIFSLSFSQLSFAPQSAGAVTSLYPFTSFTFTTGNKVGYQGPTLSQLLTSYDTSTNTWLKNSNFFTTNGSGIQIWTVPKTGYYQITAAGAQGVPATATSGGLGAIMRGTFYLVQGDKYQILVGQTTTVYPGREGLSSAGGGGTFVVKNGGTTTADILIIAGGGGGTSQAARLAGANAVADSTTAKSASDGRAGGSNGNKGTSGDSSSGAGGGFLTGGTGAGSADGMPYIQGGLGGDPVWNYSNNGGGFGGGGSITNGSNARFAGGGGYNGGGSTTNVVTTDTATARYGGGGSSFNIGTNQTNSVGNLGSGYVTIELIIPPSSISITGPSSTTYGSISTITATTSIDGLVTFYARGKRIPRCINVQTSSQVASCQYKLATRNSVGLYATLIPIDNSYGNSVSPTFNLLVGNRTTLR